MANLKVMHHGMGYPVGAVLPPAAWGDPTRHLELGALAETAEPPTVDPADLPTADVSRLDDDELAAENARLKAMLAEMPKAHATLKADYQELLAERTALAEQVEELTAERDLYKEAAAHKEHAARQRELDNPAPAAG